MSMIGVGAAGDAGRGENGAGLLCADVGFVPVGPAVRDRLLEVIRRL